MPTANTIDNPTAAATMTAKTPWRKRMKLPKTDPLHPANQVAASQKPYDQSPAGVAALREQAMKENPGYAAYRKKWFPTDEKSVDKTATATV